jgi:hypothetical protein
MKLTGVVFATLVALMDVRAADACEPEPTCGREFCWGSTGVLEATIVSAPVTENYETTIAIHVTNAWGATDTLGPGSDATIKTNWIFGPDDVGKSWVLFMTGGESGFRVIDRKVDLADYYTTMCFGADVTAESIAAVELSPGCYHTLTPVEPSAPACPNGIECSTGSARGGLPIVLSLAGLVTGRRRRRRT